MDRLRRFSPVAAGLVFLIALAAPASATTLSLDTGKTLELQPGATGNFTFSVTNDTGAITDFLGYAIGFQVVPVGTPTGSLTVGFLTQPAVDPMPAGGVDFTGPTSNTLGNSAIINGSTQFWSIGGSANDELQTVNSGANYNLASVAFTASMDATVGSTWGIYAVQQSGAFIKSYWVNGDFTDFVFGNMPATGNTSIQVGTVSIAPVPEPSSLMLGGSALGAAAWFGARRTRRNRVVVEA